MPFRKLLLAAFGVIACAGLVSAEPVWHHGVSLIGEPKYGPDFKHFDWVNPDAPKGGSVRISAQGTFDSLNPYPIKGNPAAGSTFIYDALMDGGLDEPSAEYGLIAESVSYPDDYSSVTFKLRPEARFQDGVPIKPEDVIFSLEELKKVSPTYAFYYKNIVGAEKTGEHEVTMRFDVKDNRELPQIAGQLPVLPKHYWTGPEAKAAGRDLAKSTLEPPLGSGPYRIKEVDPGRSVTLERVADYWAKDLPVMKGRWNFDQLRFEYFRDPTIAFEAFKAGKIDYYRDSSAKNWSTAYDFPAAKDGRVKKEKITLKRPAAMQAFAFNTRRDKFADPRVRQAFGLAYNFEWANKNLFYGLYERIDSYFENQDLAATGKPEGRELEILQALKKEFPDAVPDQALTVAYKAPVNDDPTEQRRNLREAVKLLKEAGWEVKNNVLTNVKTGEPMDVEFLIDDPNFERVILPYIQTLQRLGIKAKLRPVDSSQYQSRVQEFDFDIIVSLFPQSESPGNEQREFWGSAAADRPGSRNLIGIKNPAIDKLIDMIIFAPSREELVAVTHALDRVLLWQHYVVPQWFSPVARIAYWDKYSQPKTLPSQDPGFTQVWWWNAAAADKLATGTR